MGVIAAGIENRNDNGWIALHHIPGVIDIDHLHVPQRPVRVVRYVIGVDTAIDLEIIDHLTQLFVPVHEIEIHSGYVIDEQVSLFDFLDEFSGVRVQDIHHLELHIARTVNDHDTRFFPGVTLCCTGNTQNDQNG